MYYNTVKENRSLFRVYTNKTKKQDERIMAFFKRYKKQSIGPSQVWEQLFYHDVPLTSVRRSITNLTSQGKLVKLEVKRKGIYGRNEYCWQFNNN